MSRTVTQSAPAHPEKIDSSSTSWTNSRYEDPAFRLGFARQVTHCWRHNSWLAPDEIVRNARRLAHIPGCLIHGRLDISSPLDAPWSIHQAWPGSELIVVDGEGHGGHTMATLCSEALVKFA